MYSDYLYDGSKHYESRSDCNSCHVHKFLFRLAYYAIMGILWLLSAHCLLVRQRKKTADASLEPNAKMHFYCNGSTLSEIKISTSTSPLEAKIIFNKKALHERFYCIVHGWLLNSVQNIYQCIRCIIALSNQIALLLKFVDSFNSKRSLSLQNCYIIGS